MPGEFLPDLLCFQVKQQHTSEVTRLKATIEAAEVEKAQLKRTMKEELERIRTQNIFRVSFSCIRVGYSDMEN